MLYIGLDVHSKSTTAKWLDGITGATQTEKVPNDIDSLSKFFNGLEGPLFGAMESGTNSWRIYRNIESHFAELVVVDPATVWGKTIRRGAKTDGRDALGLALKMQRGELIPLYVPDKETQDLRCLTRARINATRHVTKLVNEICSLLKSWGIVPKCSLLSKEGKKLIEESRLRLPEQSLKVFDMWIRLLNQAIEAEDELEKNIKSIASKDEVCRLLMSIPNVGAFTALVIRAEIGDINRFECFEQLVSYCGLSPMVYQSGDNIHYGKLNRACNRFLKYVIILRAQSMSAMKEPNPFKSTYWRMTLKGKNNAKLAVARQLIRVIFRMLKSKERWDPSKITDRRALSASKVA